MTPSADPIEAVSQRLERFTSAQADAVAGMGAEAAGLVADAVTSRAVAPVGRLMGWSLPLARKGGFVRALKGSSVAEEFQRDAVEIRKAGGSEGRVLTVGDGVLDQPTFVAEVERLR